jgi:hypothetical protein
MRVVATIDDVGQEGLLATNINGFYRGVTQPLIAANAAAAATAAQSTIAASLNNTPMGTTPAIHLNPMGL